MKPVRRIPKDELPAGPTLAGAVVGCANVKWPREPLPLSERIDPVKRMLAGLVLVPLLAVGACGGRRAVRYEQLAQAIETGDDRAFDRLLRGDVDVDFRPEGKSSLLRIAIYSKNHHAAGELLERGADTGLQEGFYRGTPIMFAADADDIGMVDLLLDHGADVDSRDGSYGDTAINWAAYAGHLQMVAHLLEKGADPGIVGHGNALDIAMRRGFQPLVRLLAETMGATRELSGNEEDLVAAVAAGDPEGVRHALASGADPAGTDRYNRPVLAMAARQGRPGILELLMRAGAVVDAEDPIGYTALMEAARDRRLECVRVLIEHGADVNHTGNDHGLHLTPLHLGAIGGDPGVVEALAAAGARLDIKGSIGTTPLLWALFEGQVKAGIRLIELGADPTITTTAGYSAVDFARDTGDEGLSAAISAWMEDHPGAGT